MVPWNILSIMNQMATAFAALPKRGAKVGPSTFCRSPASACRAEDAQPDDRQQDKIDGRHGGGGKHRARHVAVRIDGLTDMTGGGFESRSGEPDQIETGHGAGDFAEEAVKGSGEMEGRGLMPVDMPGEDRDQSGEERQRRRTDGDRNDQTGHPAHAAQVDRHKEEHQPAGQHRERARAADTTRGSPRPTAARSARRWGPIPTSSRRRSGWPGPG